LQLEALRFLLPRDGDGGGEGFFGRGGVSGTSLRENLAADALEKRFDPVLRNFVCERQRFSNAA
jgi:hypothetical protein